MDGLLALPPQHTCASPGLLSRDQLVVRGELCTLQPSPCRGRAQAREAAGGLEVAARQWWGLSLPPRPRASREDQHRRQPAPGLVTGGTVRRVCQRLCDPVSLESLTRNPLASSCSCG